MRNNEKVIKLYFEFSLEKVQIDLEDPAYFKFKIKTAKPVANPYLLNYYGKAKLNLREKQQRKNKQIDIACLKSNDGKSVYIDEDVADLDIVISLNKPITYRVTEQNVAYSNSIPVIVRKCLTDLRTKAVVELEMDMKTYENYEFDFMQLGLALNLFTLSDQEVFKLHEVKTIAECK